MGRKSMRGGSQEEEIRTLAFRIIGNTSFLSNEDKKILNYLSTKGDYPEYEVKLVKKDPIPFVDEVEIFNSTFGKPNNYEPNIPEKKEWKFVYDFVLEELEEYKEACERGDIVEVLDALCDIAYVSLGNGTMLHGLKDKILPAYQEVQASNMSKACKTEEEAIETVTIREDQQKEPCHYELVGDVYVVYRTRDRKVMKALNYFRPDLTQFFTTEELAKNYLAETII
tara:strand:+ start:503 stop:1180 length:678 start_codon:yes stop_codon:yes gene_type:complete